MSPQSRTHLIEEILANIREGQIAAIALFDEGANAQYFINAQGKVAITGTGPRLIAEAVVNPVAPGVGQTTLDQVDSHELVVLIDALGESEAGAVVAHSALTSVSALPAYFEAYFTGDEQTLDAIRSALA